LENKVEDEGDEYDINFLEENEERITPIKSDPTHVTTIFGREYDTLVLFMNIVVLVLLFVLYRALGLFKIEGRKGTTMKIMYGIIFLFIVLEIYTTKPEVTSSNIEHNMLVFQVENLLAIFTPMVIVMLGTTYLLPGRYMDIRNNIMVGIILLFMLAIAMGHGETKNINVRIIRLFKQNLFSLGCFLFILYLLLIDTKGGNNTQII